MKKLFLQDGKLMLGDFPEYPPKPGPMSHQEFFTEFYEDDLPKYHAAVSAAKDSAVEVVNPICGAKYPFMDEGQLYDLPQGWTVEIEEQFFSVANQQWVTAVIQHLEPSTTRRKIGRLIPLKEPENLIASQIPYPDQSDFATEEEFFEACCKIRESGIAVAGVPEPTKTPEALAFVNEDDWAVSPPPQESQEDCPGKCKFPNCECSLYRRVIVAGVVDRQGISNEILNLWEQVQIWYGDIRKEETDEQFLRRIQKTFTITRNP